MKEWLTPVLVILGLVLVGFGIRAVIVKRSADSPEKQDALSAARNPEADCSEGANCAGTSKSGKPEPGAPPRPDPTSEEDWEANYHPFLGYPPEPAKPDEIMIPHPKARAYHPHDEMVTIAGGDFMMGDNNLRGARPERRAHVKSFKIDRYEVTNERYAKFIRATKHPQPELADDFAKEFSWREDTYPSGTGDHPVVLVTYRDALAYCKWDQDKRLPTEAEWERAARGPKSNKYPWGAVWNGTHANTVERLTGPLKTKSDYDKFEKEMDEDAVVRPFPVGSYPQDKSPEGVMDMHGNVSEWVDDPFEPYPGADSKDRRAFGIKGVVVVRGTNYAHRDYAAPAAARFPYKASHSDEMIGFRCVRDI